MTEDKNPIMSRNLDLQIETADRGLDIEMLGAGHVSPGTQISLADGSTVTWSGAPLNKIAGEPYVFNLVAALAASGAATVAVNVLSNWLYDKLKGGRATKLRINRTEVEIEPNKIRIVIEQIEKDGQ